MADATDDIQQGGTQEGQGETPKVYTEEQVRAMVKEANDRAYREWQSKTDKLVNAIRQQLGQETEQLRQQLRDYEKQKLQNMPPEERTQYLLEKVYSRLDGLGATAKQEPPSYKSDGPTDLGQQPAGSPEGGVTGGSASLKNEVSAVLKDMGIDPSKVDWGDGLPGMEAMKRFLASITAQAKNAAQVAAQKDEEEVEANRVGTGRGAAPVIDFLTADPLELIKQGYRDFKPIRG